MKFLTLADWTGMVETELFAQTYRSYGLATVHSLVCKPQAMVEPYENRPGFFAARPARRRTENKAGTGEVRNLAAGLVHTAWGLIMVWHQ